MISETLPPAHVGVPHASTALGAQAYDFRRPHRVSTERLCALEAMYERLAKALEGWLTSRIRGQIDVRLTSVEQFAFGEFTRSLPMPCASFIFDVTGTGQKGVIDVSPNLCTFIIDRLFGGEGTGTPLTRILTPIERMAVRGVADKVTSLLQEIWQDHLPMECTITGFESTPDVLQVADREDQVLVANVECRSGTTTSPLLICMPLSVLDTFFRSSGQQPMALLAANEEERERTRQRSEAALRSTRVPLTARLPDFQLSLRDLAQVTEGSILRTGIPKDARVIVRAGSQERFIGLAGRVNGNLAVRIVDALPNVSNT